MLKKNTEILQPHHSPALDAADLYQQVDLSSLDFNRTDEITLDLNFSPLAIQPRVTDTLVFATQAGHKQHFYMYAQPETEQHLYVTEYLKQHTDTEQAYDWVYLPNFLDNALPKLLSLPVGEGKALHQMMKVFVQQLYLMLPASLAAIDYTARFETLESELQSQLKSKDGSHDNWNTAFTALNEETVKIMLDPLLKPIQKAFSNERLVLDFLKQLADDFALQLPVLLQQSDFDDLSAYLKRYQVNLLVSNQAGTIPVVYEDTVTLNRLFGQVLDGDEPTDVLRIRPGALHQANGGFLFLCADKILHQPEIWDKLKTSLLNASLIFPITEEHSETPAGKIYPQAMPLDVQVVLIGKRFTHNEMCSKDAVFEKLFRLALDFEYVVTTNDEVLEHLLHYIVDKIHRQKLLPFNKPAVARVIEAGQRFIEDREMLGLFEASFNPLLLEANFIAQQKNSKCVELQHVNAAIAQEQHRQNRLAKEQEQEILREILLIETQGSVIGQVNGLFIIELGEFSYGLPARITATAGVGDGEVLDIEREVELGGSLHSKGVMILSAYLVSVFAHDKPISLMASLVLEQSYSQVDGDSASAGELCALLSALAKLGINQSIGVTGSINQRGELQAIGGVNEKIEGFYSLCAERGELDGSHGVIIPQANVSSLMLNDAVIEAVQNKQFSIYAASDITQVLELLTGKEKSEIYRRVDEQLNKFATIRRQYNS